MHVLQTSRNHVESVLAEFFWINTLTLEYDLREITSLHHLKEDPNFIFELIDVLTFHYIITIESFNQTAFVDHALLFSLAHSSVLQYIDMVVAVSLTLVNNGKCTATNLVKQLVVCLRIVLFHFDCILSQLLDFFEGEQAIYLLFWLHQDESETDLWVLDDIFVLELSL